jgi:hypothetical protein
MKYLDVAGLGLLLLIWCCSKFGQTMGMITYFHQAKFSCSDKKLFFGSNMSKY